MPNIVSLSPLKTRTFTINVTGQIEYYMDKFPVYDKKLGKWILKTKPCCYCDCCLEKAWQAEYSYGVVFILNKEQYKHQVIQLGDRIQLSQDIEWQRQKINLERYDPDEIFEQSLFSRKLGKDGRAYVNKMLYTYVIIAHENTWEILDNDCDGKFARIAKTTSIPFATKGQLLRYFSNPTYLPISTEQYHQLKEYSGTMVWYEAYDGKKSVNSWQGKLELGKATNVEQYFLRVIPEPIDNQKP